MKWYMILFLGVLLAGCGGGGGGYLAKGTVTSLPPGDATGSDLAGEYEIEIYTSNCQGSCPVIDYGIFTWSLCDVGDKSDDAVTVTQADGRLQVDSDGGLLVSRLIGGVYADASFDVGGWSTEDGGNVDIVVRAEGQLTSDQIAATAKAHGWGRVEGKYIDCTATYEITGNRR